MPGVVKKIRVFVSDTIRHRYGEFFVLYSVAQGLNLLTGLIVIRILNYEDYALYSIAGALIGAASTSGDLGSAGAIMTFLPKQTTVEARLRFFHAVSRLRRWFLLATIVSFSTVFILLNRNFAGDVGTIVNLALLNVIILAQNYVVLLRGYLSAERQISPISRSEATSASLRFVILAVLWIGAWPVSSAAPLIAWSLMITLQYFWLRRRCPPLNGESDASSRHAVIRFIKPLLPGHAYFIVQSILPMFSLGWLGATQEIAEFGALGRFGLVTALLTPVLVHIGHPYLARSTDETFAARSSRVLGFVLLFGIGLVISGVAFPHLWLLLLGAKYAHLQAFVPVALLLPAVSLFAATTYTSILASGETRFQFLAVAAGLASQAMMLTLAPIVDLESAFEFIIVTSVVTAAAQGALYLRVLRVLARRRIPPRDFGGRP